MKPEKRLIFIFIIEIILVIAAGSLLLFVNSRKIFCAVLFAVQIMVILYGFFGVVIPARRFQKRIKQLTHGDEESIEGIRDIVSIYPELKPYLNMMDVYADLKTRQNSAQVFNKQTELTALQSQINPHFLYNTLDTIRGQAMLDDNYDIAHMVEALSSFFRYSISKKGNLVTLRDELSNINNYMLIQRYRFSNRFSLEIIMDEDDKAAYDFLIPRLIIQPVVENAIFHGLEEKIEDGKVTIEVIVTERHLILMISDNGKGMDSKTLHELNDRIHSNNKNLEDRASGNQKSTGIALPNIHRRIQLLFGQEYGVNVYSTINQGTDVEIMIPADYKKKEDSEDEERSSAY